MNTARMVRTLRHLKSSQLRHQVVHRLRQRLTGPPVSRCTSEVVGRVRWQPADKFPRPLTGEVDDILAGRFEFVNETHHGAFPPTDWGCASASKLWQYNLHYFDWIWALVPENAVLAVNGWIERHRPGRGQLGWDAYPLSLRLMNWAMYFCGEHRGFLELEENREFRHRLFRSIAEQANCLLRCQEKHLLANHYLENGVALALVGSCFDGEPTAQAWLQEGLRILDEQLPEQCPPDGMHFERSPMYHLRLVLVLKMLIASGNARLTQRAKPCLERAMVAAGHVTHPDGEIALLADSALGIYPKVEPRPEFGAFALPDAGYFGYRSENGDYVVCDFGAPSPAYNPGHAHAGLFSFELSIAGQRVISDSGAATYQPGEERSRARSTAAHSTVELDGEDQAEMWGVFRIGRRPEVKKLVWEDIGPNGRPGFVLEAEHTGYWHGKNPRAHWRRISFDAESRHLQVEDRIAAKRVATSARIFFPLAAGIVANAEAGDGVDVSKDGKPLARISGLARPALLSMPIYRGFQQRETRASVVFSGLEMELKSLVDIAFV